MLIKLTICGLLLIFLSGYYPVLTYPPVKLATTFAQSNEQVEEVLSSSFTTPVNLPHPGYLSTKFSAWHPGIDIATGLGMPIHPITQGVVVETGTDFWGLGNYVLITHDNNFQSRYAHLGRIYAKKGQSITTENILGEVGLTGYTSGPHTHLEVTYNKRFIDPQTILPEIPDMPK